MAHFTTTKEFNIFNEEHKATIEKINKAEDIWGCKFPKEYISFLLDYNGIMLFPNLPTIDVDTSMGIWPVERMLSIEDIILQKETLMSYTWNQEHEDEVINKYKINLDKLLTFAIGERGCYYMHLDENDFGQLYYCNYIDGCGFVRLESNSINEFIYSFDASQDEKNNFKENGYMFKTNKIYDDRYYDTENNSLLGLQRFKEVYSYYNEFILPNYEYKTVIQHYVDDEIKLNFLISEGSSLDGLLNHTRKFETIDYLINKIGLNFNTSYNGIYPIEELLKPEHLGGRIINYLLIDQLMSSDFTIDWSILIENTGNLIKLKELHFDYLKREIYDKKWWYNNGKPELHVPYKKSQLIEEKLKISKFEYWRNGIFRI